MITTPTPAEHHLPLRPGDFPSLSEALDYAATGDTGFNFYDHRAELRSALTYAELREDARGLARRLRSLRLARGAHLALVAQTDPDLLRLFFACQYAGLVPVTLPASPHLSGHRAYVGQLSRLLTGSRAQAAIAPPDLMPFLAEASADLGLRFVGTPKDVLTLPDDGIAPRPLQPHELAYIQYTSGTTRLGRGVMVSQRALMSNLQGIVRHGIDIAPGDRAVSWLPWYHDMGFVGFVLAPMAGQVSVDFLDPVDFVKRPLLWLGLMTRSGATISFSPSFGYELCSRRLKGEEAATYDLRRWRVAGVGAEMIRPDFLDRFASKLAPSGFDPRAFLACYGMAECALAVSFAPLGKGIRVDAVDRQRLTESGTAVPAGDASDAERVLRFVECGQPLPGYEVEVRDAGGRVLSDRQSGVIFVRGPSVMDGYFADADATGAVLAPDGWLDTGDIGYRVDDNIVITGRSKDLLIINGRNVWPQDLEFIAEQQAEVRMGGAAAFSAPGPNGEETAVMLVECRVLEPEARDALVRRLQSAIIEELGLHCTVELVAPRTLLRTSSGKLSRASARDRYLERCGTGAGTSWPISSH
jgi:fatty-acyl-CoA synthase